MLFLCVSVYCHRVTTQLQLINIIIIIIILHCLSSYVGAVMKVKLIINK